LFELSVERVADLHQLAIKRKGYGLNDTNALSGVRSANDLSGTTAGLMSTARTAFVVDDDPGIRSALRLLLSSFGWDSRTYESAEAFLDAYTPAGEKVLIVDFNLPGMNGLELLKALALRELKIPAVIMTGCLDDCPLTQEAKAAGVIAVLGKPFRSAELIPLIEQAVKTGHTAKKEPG
jgi:FixJ family two-component response regulator